MSHTGVRIKLVIPGAGPILDGDSDWLHMAAKLAGYGDRGGPDFDQIMSGQPADDPWHQMGVVVGPVEIWVQPVMLPDDYPDDEDQADEAEPWDGT